MKSQIKNTLPTTTNASVSSKYVRDDDAALANYIQTIQRFPILSASEEYEYATQWIKNHDNAAAEKLVASHLRLVVSVAYDLKNYGVPMADLIASGNLGLMRAVQKYDPDTGNRFATYATHWIKSEIYGTILKFREIGTSANQKKLFFNLARTKRELGILDNNMTDEQTAAVAKKLDVPSRDVQRMAVRLGSNNISLNAPTSSDSDAGDMLSNLADNGDDIQEKFEEHEFRHRGYEMLRRHLAELPERDREILRARRLSDPVATLESLSQKYGISRERVRQIEERAFNKLRAAILKESQG